MHPTCIIDQRQKKKIENNKWNHIKFFILTWSVPRLHAHERPLTSALTIHPRPHPPPRLHLQVKYNNSENYKIVYLGMPLHFTIQYTPQYTAADHPLLCLTHTTPFLTHHTPHPYHTTSRIHTASTHYTTPLHYYTHTKRNTGLAFAYDLNEILVYLRQLFGLQGLQRAQITQRALWQLHGKALPFSHYGHSLTHLRAMEK